MKKIIAILLSVAIVFTLAACSANSTENTTAASTTAGADDLGSPTTESTSENTSDKKILTVYFSSANTVDAVSSATPYFDGVASTQYLAEYINSKVGGDIAKITPVKDYPESYAATAAKAKTETDRDKRPEFQALDVNPEDYDIIFVGYPMWWYTLPMVMYTFFDTYDLSGKTIIPFNTHAGSGDGGTYEEIKEFEPNATVLDGLAVSGSSANEADGDIDEWLNELDF